jgi:hypothetical protein
MKGYPPHFRRVLLWVLAACFLSGLLLVPTTLAQRAEWPVPWLPSPWPAVSRVWLAAAHAFAAFALLWFAGALWAVHMRAGWRRRRQRVSGALLVIGLGLLTLTALLLYYAGDDQLAMWAALVHMAVGLLLALPMAWHGWWRWGRRRHHHPPRTHPL